MKVKIEITSSTVEKEDCIVIKMQIFGKAIFLVYEKLLQPRTT